MRRRGTCALLAMLAMAPGARELVESAVHAVAVDGATESVNLHHDEHEDSERGCSGAFHVCACHAPSVIGLARTLALWPDPPATSALTPPRGDARVPAGFRTSIFRPPIA